MSRAIAVNGSHTILIDEFGPRGFRRQFRTHCTCGWTGQTHYTTCDPALIADDPFTEAAADTEIAAEDEGEAHLASL